MQRRTLFLALKVFSATGGIEKVSRIAGKALCELCGEQGSAFDLYAMYDKPAQLMEKYFPAAVFKGFGSDRVAFVLQSIRRGRNAGTVVLSHINLLSVGYAIKKLSPKTNVVLIAHGIEVWQALPSWKKGMLRTLDLVLPVSRFTRNKMQELYGLGEKKLVVINNGLDPFLEKPAGREKSSALLKKYGLEREDKVVLTVNRLSYKERYKGYDEVLMAIRGLKKKEPRIRYLVVGNYDAMEKSRLDRLIGQQGLQDEVIFAGFVPDEDLADHFNLADVYAMPSRKEGFGIVFIEALYYGLPVIAGNIDGSVDALAGGAFGLLVDPDRPAEIQAALETVLQRKTGLVPSRDEVLGRFGFDIYKQRLAAALGFSLSDSRQATSGSLSMHDTGQLQKIENNKWSV